MRVHVARGTRAHRAGTLAVLTIGALTLSAGPVSAEPSEQDLRQRLSELNEEYNQAKEDHEAAESRLESIESEQEEVEQQLDERGDQVRGIANSTYSGTTTQAMTFVFSDSEDAMHRAADLSYLAESNNAILTEYLSQVERLEALRAESAAAEEDAAQALEEAEQVRAEGEESLAELQEAEESSATDSDTPAASQGADDSAPEPSSGVQAVLDYARAQIGKPYVWGGTGPDAFDCSGLTLRAWEQAGVQLPRVSQDQWNFGTRVSRDELKPGDLVFFYNSTAPTHVGIYSGNGNMIHGSNPAKPIAEVSMDGYWDGAYVGAVRPA